MHMQASVWPSAYRLTASWFSAPLYGPTGGAPTSESRASTLYSVSLRKAISASDFSHTHKHRRRRRFRAHCSWQQRLRPRKGGGGRSVSFILWPSARIHRDPLSAWTRGECRGSRSFGSVAGGFWSARRPHGGGPGPRQVHSGLLRRCAAAQACHTRPSAHACSGPRRVCPRAEAPM